MAVTLVALAACQQATTPPLPWLHGLLDATASDRATADGDRRLADLSGLADEACAAGAYEPVELVAEVSPWPGRERVVGSYASGIFVFDAEDRLLASTPGFRCEGTADTLEILAAGTSWGRRTLVVVGTTGGRNDSSTWLGLFRIGQFGRLEAMFTGEVERRLGNDLLRGDVLLLPESLIYRAPGGRPVWWHFDPVPGVYIPPLPDRDHGDEEAPEPNASIATAVL